MWKFSEYIYSNLGFIPVEKKVLFLLKIVKSARFYKKS
jgi:hypothetical protein